MHRPNRPANLSAWAAIVFVLAGLYQLALFYQDNRYVHALALDIVTKAHAESSEARVVALRDYLRTHIDKDGLPQGGSGRSFLRDSAAQTLRSGKGFCGEVSRAFIVMARSLGIRAQRLNLYGRAKHVVAEAEIAPHKFAVVDAQQPPSIVDLEPLDRVILRDEYDDYSTLNLRRLHLNWMVPRLKLDVGFLTDWLERPHLIKATLCFLMVVALMCFKLLRLWIRFLLHGRGWVHVSNHAGLRAKGLQRI